MRSRLSAVVAAVLLITVLVPSAFAGNGFARIHVDHRWLRATWDSDMINIETVSQTGRGVYVAVLDTGLATDWKDYSPHRAHCDTVRHAASIRPSRSRPGWTIRAWSTPRISQRHRVVVGPLIVNDMTAAPLWFTPIDGKKTLSFRSDT